MGSSDRSQMNPSRHMTGCVKNVWSLTRILTQCQKKIKNTVARVLLMSNGILGVVLAGGLATRMGGFDKGLLQLGQQTILDGVLERLNPQVDDIVLNVNGDVERFGSLQPHLSLSVAALAYLHIGGCPMRLSGWAAWVSGDQRA